MTVFSHVKNNIGTEFSTMSRSFFKNITIFSPTPNIDMTITVNDFSNITFRKAQWRSSHSLFWPNKESHYFFSFIIWKSKIFIEYGIKPFSVYMTNHIFSRSISTVFPYRNNSYFQSVFNLIKFKELYKYESSLGGNQGSLRITNQLFSGTPQQSSIDSQSKSDDSQSTSDINSPPFSRRIPMSVLLFFGGFYLQGRGWDYFYSGNLGYGRLIVSLGVIISLAGVTLWLCNGFRWSWGWWF